MRWKSHFVQEIILQMKSLTVCLSLSNACACILLACICLWFVFLFIRVRARCSRLSLFSSCSLLSSLPLVLHPFPLLCALVEVSQVLFNPASLIPITFHLPHTQPTAPLPPRHIKPASSPSHASTKYSLAERHLEDGPRLSSAWSRKPQTSCKLPTKRRHYEATPFNHRSGEMRIAPWAGPQSVAGHILKETTKHTNIHTVTEWEPIPRCQLTNPCTVRLKKKKSNSVPEFGFIK